VLIAIVLFEGVTALDAVGPYEVLARLPGADVRFAGRRPGEVRTDTGALGLTIDATLDEVPAPDIVVVPGGAGTRAAAGDDDLLAWIRAVHPGARWTASVCTGSIVLAAAGVLRGRRATSHWIWRDALTAFGATPVEDRVVVDGDVVTAAGVSAGIDMALRLAALEAGEEVARAIQLGIEYAPEPPFDSGSPASADPALAGRLRDAARADPALRFPPVA
jgi:putative intracellular protease/amidase